MDEYILKKIINRKKEINIIYRRKEKGEITKEYNLEVIGIREEPLKDGSREVYLLAIKLPKNVIKPAIQKFIISRIVSVR